MEAQFIDEFLEEVSPSELTPQEIRLILSKIEGTYCEKFFTPIIKSNVIRLKKKEEGDCLLCPYDHDEDSVAYFKEGEVYVHCPYDDESSLIEKHKAPTKEELRQRYEAKLSYLRSRPKFDLRTLAILEEYDVSATSPLDVKKPVQVINSKMGTHKVRVLESFMEEHPDKFRSVLYLSRYNFAQNLTGGRKCCLNLEIVEGKEFLSLKLLYKLDQDFDLVIIEDCASILSNLERSFGNHIAENRAKLASILEAAKNIICTDFDADERIISMLRYFRPRDRIHVLTFKETPKGSRNSAIGYSDKYVLMVKLLGEIKIGLKVAVLCDSTHMAATIDLTIKKQFPRLKVRLYTKREQDYPRELEAPNDPDIGWSQFDVLIYTPFIGSGKDFERKYFNSMYFFATSDNSDCREMCQVLYRVGKYANTVYYYVKVDPRDEAEEAKEHTFDSTARKTQERYDMMKKEALEVAENCGALRRLINEKLTCKFESDIWLNLRVWNELEEDLSKDYYSELVHLKLEEFGFTVKLDHKFT